MPESAGLRLSAPSKQRLYARSCPASQAPPKSGTPGRAPGPLPAEVFQHRLGSRQPGANTLLKSDLSVSASRPASPPKPRDPIRQPSPSHTDAKAPHLLRHAGHRVHRTGIFRFRLEGLSPADIDCRVRTMTVISRGTSRIVEADCKRPGIEFRRQDPRAQQQRSGAATRQRLRRSGRIRQPLAAGIGRCPLAWT